MQSMIGNQSGGCTRDTRTTRQIAMETGILQRSVGRIIHRHSAKVPEETKHGRESNRASLIKQLISGEIVLLRESKPKANTLNICCDVFVRKCQFNACITVVMDSVICCVSQGKC